MATGDEHGQQPDVPLRDMMTRLEQVVQSQRDARVQAETDLRIALAQAAQSAQIPVPAQGGGDHSRLVHTPLLGKPETFDGTETAWKEWRFATRSYLIASMEGGKPVLDDAEDPTVATLDIVQSAGEGEGLHAWRLLHHQHQPKVKSRYVGMLQQILLHLKGSDGAQACVNKLRRLFQTSSSVVSLLVASQMPACATTWSSN
eukprot:985800-Amphidinium_carterae.2